ncbi:MAG: abortive infection family protein [Candidatus Azobacteroides sp.]|nr:abortive infection family protein [Candidatus Azobacteroides sp.]
MNANKISDITRRKISDEIIFSNIYYGGLLTEPEFLSRLFNLKNLLSRDHRYRNAYDDIYQHTVNNDDYPADWIYSDPRINLLYCEDDKYLDFLIETVHPRVRSNQNEIEKLLEIYNRHLNADGFEIVKNGDISGKPIFSGRKKGVGETHFISQKKEIKKYLDTEYVNNKIKIMTESVYENTELAIGTAKELLETTCKSILKYKNVAIDTNWNLAQIIKKTSENLDFLPNGVDEAVKVGKSIKQILQGLSSVVHGVTELRNSYGTGHGKDADFKGLEMPYAKLLVGVVSDIVVFYLTINNETIELVEN